MTEAIQVHVALDPGSDTIKTAFAYSISGRERTGKLVGDPVGMTAIPAVAYYDADKKCWLYGEDVTTAGGAFITVVKIRDLLRLLEPAENEFVQKSNRNFYYNETKFPKFYFPVREVLTTDMDGANKKGMTFSGGVTPRSVCECFFEYVARLVARRLGEHFDGEAFEVRPCLVYPQFASTEYKNELVRLTERAFGRPVAKLLSMAKALCSYAKYSGRLAGNVKAIIFNIGEEQTSLVKVTFSPNGVSVDGVDGHNEPAPIGGKDIDDAVARYIDDTVSRRETMGRPSCGAVGHIAESALVAKQYLFVKDIKAAKVILGMPVYESRAFRCGVPISAPRDLLIQRNVTREQFCGCTGIRTDSGVARRFADYIESELDRPVNSDTKKVFLTGGPVETYGLVEYIRGKLSKRGVSVETFEKSDEEYVGIKNDGFNIMSHEDALYSPALGCAIASLYNTDIDTVLALTYGVRLFRQATPVKSVPFFKVLVDKQTKLPPAGITYYVPKNNDRGGITTGADSDGSAPMHIMSTFFSSADIKHCRRAPKITYFDSNGENLLVVDTTNKTLLHKLSEQIGLRVLNGDIDDMESGSRAKYYYNGLRVKVIDEVYLTIGVEIDGEGFARAFAGNDMRRNAGQVTTVVYLESGTVNGVYKRSGSSEKAYKRDITFKFEIATQLT